ncbi:MAG: GNAT family N-acetyltransferase [Hyphomicrobiales bacterium]|nr:GNAT family N-acetyltransferase [Hyphomicrobiales bacterium]
MSARIVRFSEFGSASRTRITPALRRIFFATSNTQVFAGDAAREAHFDRWLGRYLRLFPADCLIAVDDADAPLAYLAGCPDSAAAAPAFADVGYYADLSPIYGDYPAHIHVNAAPDQRGRGHGRALIEAYATGLRQRGARGLHAVTAAGSGAEAFFMRSGMTRVAALVWRGRPLAALGERL